MKGSDKLISLNYRDASPIYEQVKNGYKNLIYTGVLKEDEKMPSVRELAMQLAINPNTIQRAYRELEREGFIYSIAGRGSFVSGGVTLIDKHKSEELKKFDRMVRELFEIGVTKEELIERLNKGGEIDD